ncbi:MAG TPA: TylF/MycF/NovP-related O-methyltransferase [Candidatus Dormibacteraeota bacterium]|nr:TylF/MycF/NovP-related O-methyltransferase [Candidatus Dormibacteraeota bacterium]
MQTSRNFGANSVESLYLDLLKKSLTRYLFPEKYRPVAGERGSLRGALYAPIRRLLKSRRYELVRSVPADPEARYEGRDWPGEAETMVGLRRLDHLETCITNILDEDVPGDLVEAGVWRGGASIFMRAVLAAYGDPTRRVWVADSFQGLPRPDPHKYPADAGDRFWTAPGLAISLETVQANFAKYGLLDERVVFLSGWFDETLATSRIETISLLRCDCDMYSSTTQVLQNLYARVAVGGYVIVDDYGEVAGCKAAVDDFRRDNGIQEPTERIGPSIAWRRA